METIDYLEFLKLASVLFRSHKCLTLLGKWLVV